MALRLGVLVVTATAIAAVSVASARPADAGTASPCRAGSVRWLERFDRSYAGRILRPVTVFRRPGATPVMQLAVGDSYGFPTVVPIVAQVVDRACKPTWFKVRLRTYPNGTLGWIRAGTMATSRLHKRIVVDVSSHRLVLYTGGRVLLRTAAAVGKPGTPTPLGRFYITQRFVMPNPNGPYGARALGISAFSDVLRSWREGGPVGIHGTNEPFSIGRAVSHGCVRLPERAMLALFAQVPLGTPVVVRR
jgi:lipoprotein-anchoring transpeptidase ErfK/SrfK